MEAAKESFAQRHSNYAFLYEICTTLNLLEHGLSQS